MLRLVLIVNHERTSIKNNLVALWMILMLVGGFGSSSEHFVHDHVVRAVGQMLRLTRSQQVAAVVVNKLVIVLLDHKVVDLLGWLLLDLLLLGQHLLLLLTAFVRANHGARLGLLTWWLFRFLFHYHSVVVILKYIS